MLYQGIQILLYPEKEGGLSGHIGPSAKDEQSTGLNNTRGPAILAGAGHIAFLRILYLYSLD